MVKLYTYSMMLCYLVGLSWLLYAFLLKCTDVGNTVAVISSVAVFVVCGLICRWRLRPADVRSTLLWDVWCVIGGITGAIEQKGLEPFCLAIALSGAIDIAWWAGNKRYKGLAFMEILDRELHINPQLEFLFLIGNIFNAIENDCLGHPVVWIIEAFLLFDFIRQGRKGFLKDFPNFGKNYPRSVNKFHKNMQTLKNDILTVQVKEHGAELASIKKGSTEYLWQADPAFWGRHSPVLFPIVGSVWDKKYRVGDKEFELGQHGFARDMDFTLISANDTEVRYCLMSDEETLEKYPWRFALEIGYRLHGNRIDVIWEVKNIGDGDMYFQIGAHPAFNYPDYNPETKERGYLSFDRPEGLECIRIKEKGCVDAETKYPLEVPQDGLMPLTRETFDVIDTIMLQDAQIGKVTLHRKDRTPWLALSFDAPVVGIWSPPTKNAPFICLEPWYGRCDRAGYAGDFRGKDWINRLAAGEKFSSVYTMEIF